MLDENCVLHKENGLKAGMGNFFLHVPGEDELVQHSQIKFSLELKIVESVILKVIIYLIGNLSHICIYKII